jgi:uncharacterized membrane protein SpoIIM required for sporulation
VDLDSYIARHRGEWSRLDEFTRRGARRPAGAPGPEVTELVRLYLRASSHLAEVQSRYHDANLEDYLNGLVTRARGAIYATEARSFRLLVRLFGTRYRTAIRATTPHILVVAALLSATIVLADLWVATSPEAQAGLVAPQAREAVRQAGGRVDLDTGPDPALSARILQNNLQVAFLAFALGITLGVGTILVVFQNGVFIGLLAGAFHAAGGAPLFWALVLPHGFLELIAICIAAGAGLRMGWSIVDPGDRSRVTALGEESRDAVLVVVGVIPAFAITATIEGLLTGRTGLPLLEVGVGAVVAVAYLAFLFVPDRARPRADPAP